MKLRLTSDSIRLRLNRTEVDEFSESGELTERIEFLGLTPTALVYCLRFGSELGVGSVNFSNGEFVVTVPQERAKTWAHTRSEVGLYYNRELANGKSLRISVEKDFQCIDGRLEEYDPEAYPNPR
jgi:hypothetical protein